MSYTFSTLSPADFEDLVRELIGRELGVRFEAFCAGPDGGIDGRHAPGRGSKPVVLQAKHYEGSAFPKLLSAMKRERAAIGKLTPSRYILATSRKLTPGNKKTLSEVIETCVVNEGDIFGPDDLNGLLRKYPEVEKSHIGPLALEHSRPRTSCQVSRPSLREHRQSGYREESPSLRTELQLYRLRRKAGGPPRAYNLGPTRGWQNHTCRNAIICIHRQRMGACTDAEPR